MRPYFDLRLPLLCFLCTSHPPPRGPTTIPPPPRSTSPHSRRHPPPPPTTTTTTTHNSPHHQHAVVDVPRSRRPRAHVPHHRPRHRLHPLRPPRPRRAAPPAVRTHRVVATVKTRAQQKREAPQSRNNSNQAPLALSLTHQPSNQPIAQQTGKNAPRSSSPPPTSAWPAAPSSSTRRCWASPT